jgi:hypothetical protein
MRLNDSDVKKLVDVTYDMRDRLIRIEEKVVAIHACNGEQDIKIKDTYIKLEDQCKRIGLIDNSITQINTKLIGLFVVGTIVGGIIGNIITKLTGF